MQQMFLMVNILLRENPETRKRRLRVRSYKVRELLLVLLLALCCMLTYDLDYQLNLFTWQVIPLTPCAGLLEWVQNTIPLGQYLIGTARDYKSGAHVRYRPGDMLSADCRKEMQEAATAKKRRKVHSSSHKTHTHTLTYTALVFRLLITVT
jgi:ataxia telangiectasia mutated family protein